MKYKVDCEKVKNALDKFEWEELNNTGMRKINGGYAEADIFNYDEEYFDIELKWGEQDMGSGSSVCHTEQFKMNRETLEITN